MPSLAVDIDRLNHFFGSRRALDHVSVQIEEGILFGVLGPNGGGKTTLFRILATLIHPTEGRVRVLEADVTTEPKKIRRRVGIVFQDPALDDELTVRENLAIHGALYGLQRAVFEARMASLMPLFGLQDRGDERVDRLSGGLRRRADLVRGLLHAPRILLLDEPTTGLDPAARHAFWDAVDRLRRSEQVTILLATHLMDEADRCDRLAILDAGRMVASGTPSELKQAVGDETLWIDADDPHHLADRIEREVKVAARVIGSRVQISAANAHELLPQLYETFPGLIQAATLRRPTLEDVFMVHAGHEMTSVDGEVPS